MTDDADIIGTDTPLTRAEQVTVDLLLDMIIPPSSDGRMPGAAQFDVIGYIRETAGELLPALREELEQLDRHALAAGDAHFADLAAQDRNTLLDGLREANPEFLRGLALQTTICYYQQDRVLEAIGMDARAPFPEGYEVKSGDLTLLDPVRARGKVFRDA